MPQSWQLAAGAETRPGQGYRWSPDVRPSGLNINPLAGTSSIGGMNWNWKDPVNQGRFNWQTPGAGLEAWNIANPVDTWDRYYTYANQPGQIGGPTGLFGGPYGGSATLGSHAVGLFGGWDTGYKETAPGQGTFLGLPVQYDRGGRGAYLEPDLASNPLLRKIAERNAPGWDAKTNRLYIYNPTWRGQDRAAVQFINEARQQNPGLDLDRLTNEQKASLVDSVIRGRQEKNQQPKRFGFDDFLGGVLPMAAGLVPGLGPLAATMLSSGLGAVGSIISGSNPLTGAFSSGFGNVLGSVLPKPGNVLGIS